METEKQTTNVVLMVRPLYFGYNEQTAASNAFQEQTDTAADKVRQQAVQEFDSMVALLRAEGVEVLVLNDPSPQTPDAVFPNNWISFHGDKGAVLYPMEAPNRRLERRQDLPQWLQKQHHFKPFSVLDLSGAEQEQQFLEGTGSLVLDRQKKLAYACLSTRTHLQVLQRWSHEMDYELVLFHAYDRHGVPIYHTNVLMAVGEKLAVICLDALPDPAERELVTQKLQQSGKELVPITFAQMEHFAGNMLELRSAKGDALMVMSAQAKASLTEQQLQQISRHARILSPDISSIETHGGGSVRCMMAEVFLPRND